MSFFLKHNKKLGKRRGFTLVELIVSVAIFSFLTAFLVAKYGNFNSSVLLTNLAYDVALTLRNAQTYGLNVKSRPSVDAAYTDGTTYSDIALGYQYAYGVHFEADANGGAASRKIVFFSDNSSNPNNVKYTPGNGQDITSYTLRNGYIADICPKTAEDQNNCIAGNSSYDIWFKRPEPSANFSGPNITYVEITIKSNGGTSKRVAIRKTGQIVILRN